MGEAVHLTRRFLGAIVPGGPSQTDATWADRQLLSGEADLWRQMSNADRRHAAGVARRVDQALGPDSTRPILAAGLLHDVGKVACGLGTVRRVVATVLIKVSGRRQAICWSARRGFRRSVALYADHPRIGAELLERAGSEPVTVAWAREHHLPSEQWSVTRPLGEVLKAADDD